MAYDFQKINVRGVDFAAVTPDEAAAVCTEMLDGDRACTVFTPNAEIVQLCVEQNEYYALYNGGDLVVPDGAGVVKAAKILGRPLPGKVAGVELGERMLAVCAARGDGVYFLGAKPGVAEEAAKRMTEKYPGLRIVGTHDARRFESLLLGASESMGPQGIDDRADQRLGVPVQERWTADNKDAFTTVRVCMCLGGSLDVYAGVAQRAPKFFVDHSLEWFYRLMKEPKRIGRMMKLPKFLFGTYLAKFRGKA